MTPGTVCIPELRGVFVGFPACVVIHEQHGHYGRRGKAQTKVELRGPVRSARALERILERDVEGFIDDRPFLFFGVQATRAETDYQSQLGMEIILTLWASPRVPVLHPVVAARRAKEAR